jgi:hypothetical protein
MTTVSMIEVLDPTGVANRREIPLAARPEALGGLVVGFLDNTKPNADLFLERVRDLLVQRHRFAGVVSITKATASAPAAEDLIERLAERCDIVINAWGD